MNMGHYLLRQYFIIYDLTHGDLLQIFDFLLMSKINDIGDVYTIFKGQYDRGLDLHMLGYLLWRLLCQNVGINVLKFICNVGELRQSHTLRDLELNGMELLFNNLALRFSLYELKFSPCQILLFSYLRILFIFFTLYLDRNSRINWLWICKLANS